MPTTKRPRKSPTKTAAAKPKSKTTKVASAPAEPAVAAVSVSAEEAIRFRAYEIFEQRGRRDGSDVDDWLRAEAEVLAQYGAGPA